MTARPVVQLQVRLPQKTETELRRVFYPWHSLYGQEVVVKGEKAGRSGTVFRCQLGEEDRADRREIPAWMFDRAFCERLRLTAEPHVSLGALAELRDLFRSTGSASKASPSR